jgi:hypothetical protein
MYYLDKIKPEHNNLSEGKNNGTPNGFIFRDQNKKTGIF